MLVFDGDGQEIGDVVLSEHAARLLDLDTTLTLHFHTPQLLRFKLGEHNFSFRLNKLGERATTPDSEMLRLYIRLQRDIRKAMEELNGAADPR